MRVSSIMNLVRSGISSRSYRRQLLQAVRDAAYRERAVKFLTSLRGDVVAPTDHERSGECAFGSLEGWFRANQSGPGVWKWKHYFPAYEQALSRYRGRRPVVAEIGVFSGGSLRMWRDYFGPGAHIHGIDIDPSCRSYESDGVSIHIGDQGSRAFWRGFRLAVPHLDVLIDDGGHLTEQQLVTLEETLGHIAPGGTLIVEDIHGCPNEFSAFLERLVGELHSANPLAGGKFAPTAFQGMVESLTVLPFMVILRKRDRRLEVLESERRGTEWQPAKLLDNSGHIIHGRGA
jgi:hypothetical protein